MTNTSPTVPRPSVVGYLLNPLRTARSLRKGPGVENVLNIDNRCRCQSITQHYIKRCLIKNSNNYMYMFRPIEAIIGFSFESMVVALIGLVWLYHDGEISTSVMFAVVGDL